jgi:hypothetical protein
MTDAVNDDEEEEEVDEEEEDEEEEEEGFDVDDEEEDVDEEEEMDEDEDEDEDEDLPYESVDEADDTNFSSSSISSRAVRAADARYTAERAAEAGAEVDPTGLTDEEYARALQAAEDLYAADVEE